MNHLFRFFDLFLSGCQEEREAFNIGGETLIRAPLQFQCSFSAVSVQFQCSFSIISGQFRSRPGGGEGKGGDGGVGSLGNALGAVLGQKL